MPERTARVTEGGRIVIPGPYRAAMGLHVGDEVVLRLEDGELRIISREQAIRRAQALVRQFVPVGRSLGTELIAERRADAARE